LASTGRLQFAQALPESITAEAVMIAVNSPISSNGSVDLSQVQSAVNEIANKIHRPFTLLMKSTVLLGPGVDLIDRFLGTGQ
jgi:UDP-glucose 6-dehydrogenase